MLHCMVLHSLESKLHWMDHLDMEDIFQFQGQLRHCCQDNVLLHHKSFALDNILPFRFCIWTKSCHVTTVFTLSPIIHICTPHTHIRLTYPHWHSPQFSGSSLPSPQLSARLHTSEYAMHFPLSHWNYKWKARFRKKNMISKMVLEPTSPDYVCKYFDH